MQCLDAGLAGAHFQIHHVEFGAQFGMRVAQIFAHPQQGLIEGKTGFDANHREIESVGKTERDARCAIAIFRFSAKRGRKKPNAAHADQKQRRIAGR